MSAPRDDAFAPNSDDVATDTASPFRPNGSAGLKAGTLGLAEAKKIGKAHEQNRIPPKAETRFQQISRVWKVVALEIGGKENDYRDWKHDNAEQRIADDATDADIAVFVHDWFCRYMDKFPLYQYRAHEWDVAIRAWMATFAASKGMVNKTNVDEIIKTVLDHLKATDRLGNTLLAKQLFEDEFSETREDFKMATQPLIGNGSGGTTKPIATASAAVTAEWYEDEALKKIFFGRDFGPFCTAVGIENPEMFRKRVMGTEHTRECKFKSWTELFTACIRTHLDDKPHDWSKIPSEVTAFWGTMGQDKRSAILSAMMKRFETDDVTAIDMDMGRHDFQVLITAVMAETATPVNVEQRAADTDAFFAKAEGKPAMPQSDDPLALRNVLRQMYKAAGVDMTVKDFQRATGFSDLESARVANPDAEIIGWVIEDIAKTYVKPADEKPLDASNVDEKAPSLSETAKSGIVDNQIENKPVPEPVSSNVIVGNFVHPETVVVYPLHNGSIVYAGIRFSVTLRAGGTMAAAKALMDEFAMCKELIDPSCIVEEGGKASFNEQGTAIMRMVKNDKVSYEIYFNLPGGNECDFPILISTPQALEMLEASLTEAGVKLEKMVTGKRYASIRVNPHWNNGKEMKDSTPEKRKYFKDYTRFDVTVDAGEVKKTA